MSPKNIRKLCADVGVSQKLKGVCGSTLDRYIRQKRHFGVKGIVKPKWSQTLKHLKSGGGVIIRFRWFREGKSSGHYSFLCIDSSGKIVVANPHLIVGAKSRDRWRYATPKDIEDFSKNITVGRRVYPMIWPIERL